jgi:hypothetical protein
VAFLRFSRDRRGYENTFLLDGARPRGEKDRPRLLYWFRTPPHLKVGRTPFDEDAMRLLEDQHPDVEFDWARLLESSAAALDDEAAREGDVPDSTDRLPETPLPSGASPPRASGHRRRGRGGR